MEAGLIPQRYAKALYKFALEQNRAEDVYNEMKRVVDSFTGNPDLAKVLSNPFVDTADKEKVLLAAAGTNPGDDYSRFVKLILDHHREEYALLMALAYRDLYRRENKISQVKISVAAELPEEQMQKLRNLVEKSFPGRTFEHVTVVEPELIGGFVIDVDSTRLDASVSGELEQLRQNLLN